MTEMSAHRGGAGSPMVCIHGMSDSWRTWQTVLPGLEAKHDVLVIALPGHRNGPGVPEGTEMRMALFADALEAELDLADISTAHLVGNSLGGWLSLELAARGRARSVVALSPAGGWQRGTTAERRVEKFFRRSYASARAAAPYADLLARLPMARQVALRDVVSRPTNISRATFAEMTRSIAACSVVLPAMDVLRNEGFQDELGRIDCPVRIAWGTGDRILRLSSASARFRTLVPDAEFVELPGLGHVPMTDDPELVTRSILEVTTRVDGESVIRVAQVTSTGLATSPLMAAGGAA